MVQGQAGTQVWAADKVGDFWGGSVGPVDGSSALLSKMRSSDSGEPEYHAFGHTGRVAALGGVRHDEVTEIDT